ncbi:MAG: DinB family protein [Cyclobacteriaceae bacterium]|nr:DinB family protein [Cyclobacteriaceae bacterium]
MHPTLQTLFNQIEDRREAILNSFRSLSEEQLNQRPRDGQWSAAEVLNHLVTAERLSVAYIQKKVQGLSELPRTGWWDDFKMGLLIISQRMPGLKFKAPRRVVENTTRMTSLAEIEVAWKAVREDLKMLLESLPEQESDRKIYRHPAVGYLNIRHALIFFREHLIHHAPQLRALLKS